LLIFNCCLIIPRLAQRDDSNETSGSVGCFTHTACLLLASWMWFQDGSWHIAETRVRSRFSQRCISLRNPRVRQGLSLAGEGSKTGHRDEYGKRIESPNDGGLQATGGAASASASADEDRVRGGNWWPAHGERHMFLVSSPLYCNAKEAQDKKANTNITEAFSAFRLSTPPLPGPCSFSFAQFLVIGLCIDFCCK
jgi:hypothetical protein